MVERRASFHQTRDTRTDQRLHKLIQVIETPACCRVLERRHFYCRGKPNATEEGFVA